MQESKPPQSKKAENSRSNKNSPAEITLGGKKKEPFPLPDGSGSCQRKKPLQSRHDFKHIYVASAFWSGLCKGGYDNA